MDERMVWFGLESGKKKRTVEGLHHGCKTEVRKSQPREILPFFFVLFVFDLTLMVRKNPKMIVFSSDGMMGQKKGFFGDLFFRTVLRCLLG